MTTQTTLDLQPPSDIAAEEALLGSLLLDPLAIERLSFLRPEDFYRERHGAIFGAMRTLIARGQTTDHVTLISEMERQGQIQNVGGAAYIVSLINATPSAVFAEQYAKRIEHFATLRRVIRAGSQIVQDAYQQPEDLDTLMANAEAKIYEARTSRGIARIIAPEERAKAAYDRYQRWHSGDKDGIPYGLLAFDKWTQGAEPGQLIIIAGRPAMGKTSLLYNIAQNMARTGRKVLFGSVEMPDSQLTDRDIAGRTQLTLRRMREANLSDEDWTRIAEAVQEVSAEPLYTFDAPDATTAAIKAAAIEMRARHGLDALFVDYLQLLHDKTKHNEVERVTGISRELKAIARSLGVPVLVTAQLNRAVEGRDNKMPQLSDLRDSGSIEQDADLVAFIYRPGYYSRDLSDRSAQIIIAKQRNGPAGITSPLWFDHRATRFQDAEVHYED